MGSSKAYSGRGSCRSTGRVREAVGPVVLTVRVEVAPLADGDMEAGFSEQVGAREGAGETEHVRATSPANP